MKTDRTSSRCAPALVQIWASEAAASSFAHCDGCPGDSRPYPGIVGLSRPRPRRAFWQVTSMIAYIGTFVNKTRGRFVPRLKIGVFTPGSL
jgi:hypothetical protein